MPFFIALVASSIAWIIYFGYRIIRGLRRPSVIPEKGVYPTLDFYATHNWNVNIGAHERDNGGPPLIPPANLPQD